VLDYVGGLADLERRVIRTIGDADVRFREDPVRILRAIRFCARLDLGIEPDTYDAMIAHREDILRAARPRILEEVLRLLRAGAARRSFWLAWETGVLSVILPDVAARLDDDPDGHTLLWRRLAALDAMVARGAMPGDSVLLALLLLDPLEEALEGARNPTRALDRFVEGLREQLAVTRKMEDRLRQMVPILSKLRDGRWQTLTRRECFTDAAVLHLLDCDARGLPAEALREVLNDGASARRPVGRRPSAGGVGAPPAEG
jgi:poly(A) polymerase